MTSTRWDNDDDYSVPTIFELTEYLKKLNEDQGKNWYKIKECEKYLGWLEACPNLDCPPFGTPFAAIFGPGCTEDATTTMMQALWLDEKPPLPPNGLGGPSSSTERRVGKEWVRRLRSRWSPFNEKKKK